MRLRIQVLGKYLLAVAVVAMASCEQSSTVDDLEPKSRPRRMLGENPLLGQQAPAFRAVDPDGNEVDLKQYLGKNVIMLDFWATWCGPCIMAMPEITAVANRYKDRGLVFFAVNVGEDPDTVKEFLEANKIDLPVVMDFEGEIQNLFHGDGLPYTILIGKDGRVQVVHRGYRRGFGTELSVEVAELLDGKSLVD